MIVTKSTKPPTNEESHENYLYRKFADAVIGFTNAGIKPKSITLDWENFHKLLSAVNAEIQIRKHKKAMKASLMYRTEQGKIKGFVFMGIEINGEDYAEMD